MATVKWRGGAASVAQVTTITFSAYTVGETYTITCNGKDVTYTAGASTLGDVIDGLVAAIGATTEPEFADFTAENDSGLVLTGSTAGVPFTVTASASGAITATVTETTAATGPNHFDNADNWEGGSVPGSGDDLLFEDNSVSLLYALEDTGTNYGDISVRSTFTGEIGLPARNASGYQEYRPRFLKLGDGSPAFAITIGQGSGRQSSLLQFDGNDASVALSVYGTGTSTDAEAAVILKNFDANSTADIYGGSVLFDADTSAEFANLRITPGNSFSAPSVIAKENVDCGEVLISGGTLTIAGSATSVDASNGSQVTISNAATCPTVKAATGAVVNWSSTADVTTKVFAYAGGTVDFSGNGAEKSVAAASCYENGIIRDPLGVVTWETGIRLEGSRIADTQVDVGRDKVISTTAVVSGQQVLDSENADRDLTSQVTVLTHTPSVSANLICTAVILLGDGTKDLDGSGGTFEIEVTIGGNSWLGGPQSYVLGTQVRAALQVNDFVVPAGDEVVIKVLSPNGADTDVDTTCILIAED